MICIPDSQVGKTLTDENRKNVLDHLRRLRTPAVIQCATGCRAEAVALLGMALREGWSAEATLKWAEALNSRCWDKKPLKDWIAGLNVCESSLHPALRPKSTLIFRQLFERESCTYSYLLADAETREGVLIDPVDKTVDRDIAVIKDLGISLKYASKFPFTRCAIWYDY